MPLLLGLIVAASFGTGDFLGGLASRRAATLVVLAVAQLCALVGAVVVAIAAGGEATTRDLLLGALAGTLNVGALGCLYRGLAVGQIGVVAPIAAMIGAVIPVGWGLLIGERPSPVALVGVGLAVIAGGLISRERDTESRRPSTLSLLLAVGAGVGFGTSLICYGSTGDDSGFWPVLAGRVLAVSTVLVAVGVTRAPRALPRSSALQSAAAGGCEVAATALLLVAIRTGLFATVAPVASLAPGFTVGHAHWYLHERATRVQIVGLALALVGLALIAQATA